LFYLFLEREASKECIKIYGQLGLAFGDSIIPVEIRNDLTLLLSEKEKEAQKDDRNYTSRQLPHYMDKRETTVASAEQILPAALASLSLVDGSNESIIHASLQDSYHSLLHRLVDKGKIDQAYKLFSTSFVMTDLRLNLKLATEFMRVLFRMPGGWKPAFELYTKLNDTYFARGEIEPDMIFYLVLYTGMIFAQQGQGKEIQSIIDDMEERGIETDDMFYCKLTFCALMQV
jgi:hypothetical protein